MCSLLFVFSLINWSTSDSLIQLDVFSIEKKYNVNVVHLEVILRIYNNTGDTLYYPKHETQKRSSNNVIEYDDLTTYFHPKRGLYDISVNDHFSGIEISDTLIPIYPKTNLYVAYKKRYKCHSRGGTHLMVDDNLLHGSQAKQLFESSGQDFRFFSDPNNLPYIFKVEIKQKLCRSMF